MLSPCLEFNYQLDINAEVDLKWYQNIKQLISIFFNEFQFNYCIPKIRSLIQLKDQANYGKAAGLCFSGGVDSFYSLFHFPKKINYLIIVQGFDIDLEDHDRMQFLKSTAQQVAKLNNLEVIIIRTNLRSHSFFSKQDWKISSNGALAALGFLLNCHVNQLIISSECSKFEIDNPIMKFWKINSFFSSSNLNVLYYGNNYRLNKIGYIAENPIVKNNLRVCWQNKDQKINCSTCTKCVATRLALAIKGNLEEFHLFKDSNSLVEDIAAIHTIDPAIESIHLQIIRFAITCLSLSANVRNEARLLYERSIKNLTPIIN